MKEHGKEDESFVSESVLLPSRLKESSDEILNCGKRSGREF